MLISAIRTILNAGATISCAGGAGSQGVSTYAAVGATGGGGGGGGQVILISPTVPLNNATINLSGGVAGAANGNGGAGGSAPGNGGGIAGSVGRLFVGTFVALGG